MGKQLDKKANFNFKIYDVTKDKDNQTMKFGQLVEYKVRKIFLQKLCRK